LNLSANRYSRKEKKSVSIPQPKVITEYNQQMGDVYLHGNGISNYKINVKTENVMVATLRKFDRQCYRKFLENIQFGKQIKIM